MFSTHAMIKNRIKKIALVISLMLFSYQTLADQTPTDITEKRPPCLCTKQWEPVCGANGRTYGNICEANCAHVAIEYEGACSREH
jgi:hypothetical protein